MAEPREQERRTPRPLREITTEMSAEFLDNRGWNCPGCFAVLYGPELKFGHDGDGVVQVDVTCSECHAQWRELYDLTGLEEIPEVKT